MGERLIASVRLQMFSEILSTEIGWFDNDENSTGALSSKLATDSTLVRSALADRLSTLVRNTSLSVTAFVIAFVLSWRIAAIVRRATISQGHSMAILGQSGFTILRRGRL